MEAQAAGSAGGEFASGTPQKDKGGVPAVILQALTAVGAGIGVLGFVVFFGGAVLWVRYDKVGLPANDVIAVIPKPVLLTTGASFLVPALIVALGVVLLIVVVSLVFTSKAVVKDLRQDGDPVRNQANAELSRREADQWLAAAKRLERLAALGEEVVEPPPAGAAEPPAVEVVGPPPADGAETPAEEPPDLLAELAKVNAQREEALGNAAAAELAAVEAEKRLPDPRTLGAIPRLEQFDQKWRTGITLGIVIIVIVVELWKVADGAFSIGKVVSLDWAAIGLLILAVVTAGAGLLVYDRTTNLAWLAVALFLSVGIFDGAAAYARTIGLVKVQPAAVLLKGQGPLTGFFVAETSTRLYMGVGDLATEKTRLVAIPTDNVAAFEVGDLVSADPATSQAAQLGLELCKRRDHQRLGTGAGDPAQPRKCTPSQEKRLRNRWERPNAEKWSTAQ